MKSFESFGKYLLLERLAAGGMAEVFLAKSTGAGGISKFVAIKRILPQYSDNPEFIDMFKEEARIAMNLNHGNVVSIYDFGVENKQFFLVMEYVEGQNLRQILNHLKKESKEFSTEQGIYITKQIAAGLDHAHRCIDSTTGRPLNITHRDMSPQNIMISFEGEVKVVDFGIAKAESQMEHTRAGTIKGKFGYMSPEQAEGQIVDIRTDIFSLGIVLWELLAKDRLFTASSEAATLKKIRECQIPSLRRINPAIPPELERITNKALAKDKSLRYQTSAALHKDLNRFLNTQYPDFSPQDFSIYMKSAFSQMYIENRKKQVEYAKAQGIALDERTVVTATATLTDANHGTEINSFVSPPQTAEEFLQVDHVHIDGQSQSKVDLKQLKTKDNAMDRSKRNGFSQTNSSYSIATRNTRQHTSPITVQKESHWMMPVLPLLVIAAGGFWWWKKNIKTPNLNPVAQVEAPATVIKPAAIETSDFASKQTFTVTIESNPSGARIYIDGQDTGSLTPFRRQVEGQKDFRVGFVKEGYTYFEKIERVTQDASSIKATLQVLPPMGYVSINVMNGGSDPIIYIDNQRINQKPPIRYYGIAPNKNITVRVVNPFSKLSAETTVKVGVSEKKELNLILSREAQNR